MYKKKLAPKRCFISANKINADRNNTKHCIGSAATSKFITRYSYEIYIDHHRQLLVIKYIEIDPSVNTIPIPGKKVFSLPKKVTKEPRLKLTNPSL